VPFFLVRGPDHPATRTGVVIVGAKSAGRKIFGLATLKPETEYPLRLIAAAGGDVSASSGCADAGGDVGEWVEVLR
jgi:hypothetical protein